MRFQSCREIARKVDERCQEKWAQRWEGYRATIPETLRTPATRDALFENTSYHEGLRKAESSVAVQFRSGKNGLNAFLKQANVPGILSSRYPCGWAKQDAKHVLLFCPEYRERRAELVREAGTYDFRKMLSGLQGIRAAARWVIRAGCLEQFRLAQIQLGRSRLPAETLKPPQIVKKAKAKRRKKG